MRRVRFATVVACDAVAFCYRGVVIAGTFVPNSAVALDVGLSRRELSQSHESSDLHRCAAVARSFRIQGGLVVSLSCLLGVVTNTIGSVCSAVCGLIGVIC